MSPHIATIKQMYGVNANAIRKIYTQYLHGFYDQKLSQAFAEWKAQAINASALREGDNVMVFCCGSGNDFVHIQNKIGNTGRIVGVDFSSQMLNLARQKIKHERWDNIELIEADVTMYTNHQALYYDAGVCTLGMSIIPEYMRAYHNLLSHIRNGGEVIIGDLQLVAGWRSLLNVRIIYRAKEFGGSYQGHKNTGRLFAVMEEQLSHIRKKHFYNNAYTYCIGTKP